MKITDQLKSYTDWFKNNSISQRNIILRNTSNPRQENGFPKTVLGEEMIGYVTVQIFDRKTDALFLFNLVMIAQIKKFVKDSYVFHPLAFWCEMLEATLITASAILTSQY